MINENISVPGVSFAKTAVGKRKMDKICSVALKLFHDNGFMRSQVLDICNTAGMAVGTFYVYFEDKMALFTYAVKSGKIALLEHIDKFIQHNYADTLEEKVGIAARGYISFFIDNPYLYSAMWGDIVMDKKSYDELLLSSSEQLANYFFPNIKDKAKCNSLAFFLLGGINMITAKLRLKGSVAQVDIEEEIEQTVAATARGFQQNLQTFSAIEQSAKATAQMYKGADDRNMLSQQLIDGQGDDVQKTVDKANERKEEKLLEF